MSHVHNSFYDIFLKTVTACKYNTLNWERFRPACEERKRRSGCNKGSGRWNVQLVVIHRQKNSSVHTAVHVIHSDHGCLVLLDVTQLVGAQAGHIVGHYQRALWEMKVRIQWDLKSVILSPLWLRPDYFLIFSSQSREGYFHTFILSWPWLGHITPSTHHLLPLDNKSEHVTHDPPFYFCTHSAACGFFLFLCCRSHHGHGRSVHTLTLKDNPNSFINLMRSGKKKSLSIAVWT